MNPAPVDANLKTLTVPQAAEALGISRQRMYQLIIEFKIEPVSRGSRGRGPKTIYAVRDLIRLIDAFIERDSRQWRERERRLRELL